MNLCWYHQKRIAWELGEGPLPQSTQRHLRSCPSCQSAQSAARRLTAALTSSRLEADSPPFLATRIQAHLPEHESAPTRSPWRTLAAFASVILLGGLLMQLIDSGNNYQGLNMADAEESSEFNLPKIPPVSNLAKKLDDPLEMEIQRVIQDTRQAYQYVASNFLPSNQE